MKGFGIEGIDPWSLASYLKMVTGDTIGYRVSLSRSLQRKWPIVSSPLPLVPGAGYSLHLRLALGTFREGAAKIVNPKIKGYFANSMVEGDTYCELIFEERE